MIRAKFQKKLLWTEKFPQEQTTQAASAETAQTTDDLFESSQNRKSETTVPEKGTPKENLSVPQPDTAAAELATEKQVASNEQVGEQVAPAEWGERHDDLANKGSKAVAELRKRKSGWVPDAWVRDDIGGIALPYGKTDAEVKAENKGRKTGYGLAHIDERHPDLDWDLADDAIRNGNITEQSGNRIILEHTSNDQKHRVIVQIDFDQISQNWLVTVYKKVAESPANPLTTAHDNKGVADNITPENSASTTIPQSAEKSSGGSEKIISEITSAKAGSRERIMAFTELSDGEHTVNGKSFTKSGNAFTLDGKTLNAKEIEKATRTTSEKMRKTVEETVSDAEIGYTPKTEAKPADKPTLSDKMRGKGKKKSENKPSDQSEVSEKSEKSEKIPETINENSSEKEVISFLENHYERIDDNTKKTVFRKLVDYLKESPLHLKAIPQKVKVKSKKLLDALFPFTNNKDARAAYTVVKVTDKEITATDGKILVVAQNTSGVEPGAYSLKKRQIVKEEISKYPDLSIITSKKYTDSTNADSLLTDGRVDGTVDIYKKLLDDGFFGGTAPVILKFGKSSIQVDVTNLKKVLDLFRSQGIENITVSSLTQEIKFNGRRIFINNIIRIQGGDISAYIIGLNPDRIGGGGGIAEIALQEKTDESGNTILFSKPGDLQQNIEEVNQKFNDDLDRQIAGTLPKGYIHQLGTPGDILLSTGVPNLPIELSSTRLEEKSKQENHPFDIADLKNLPKLLQEPIGVFAYGNKDNAQNIIIEVQQNGRNFLIGLSFNFEHDGLIVNSIRGLFAKETAFWLRWIEQGKTLYIDKEKVQKLIAQQRTNLADVNNLDLNSINNIIQNFENPSVSSKNPENSLPLTPQEEADLQNNENFASEIGNGLKFSLVTDRETIDRLDAEEEAGDYLTLYRSVQIGPDGKLHSPMAAVVDKKWGPVIELGKWEQSDERPDLAKAKIAKDGKIKYLFDLNKGNGKTISGVLYNPYIHSSNTMLNDQFSEAYQRPELVTVEVHVPKSELTSGYKASKANAAVGMKDWKAGVVQGKLTGKRKVMLSRWDKPVRIVPDSEVAQHIKELIGDKDIAIPANVVTPALRAELEKLGVKIDYSVKEYVPEKEQTEVPEIKFSKPGDLAADIPGENLVVVHNTTANKLRNALKLGGMPAPSLAVIDTEKSDFSDFGEITLIAEKELIDPKNKKNKVYNADIYSPRSPQIVYEYSEKDYDRAFEKIKSYETREADDRDSIDKLVYYHKNGMTDRDFAEDLKRLPAVRVWFNRTNTTDQDFDTWWETVALPELNFSQDGKIFNGYTASGRKKWLPGTLENVVKLMTKKIRNGEGFNYGIGNIRSMVAKQFKSIADIKKNRESIVSEEAFKAVKKDIQNEFRELEEEMRQASVGGRYGWSFDTGSDCLLAMAEGGRENMQYLKDRFGDNEEILGKMAEFLKKLENLPTEYFEAKPQRALNLDEFRSAVIPEDTPADVKKSLENAGVEVFTYKDKSDRKTVLQKATANKGIKFSRTGDLDLGDTSLSPEDYRRSIDPLFDFVMEYTDGIVNPGSDHIGEDFDGSYISEAYNKFSTKRKQGKNESDASYQRYLAHRQEMLNKADGYPLDTLAAAYVDKFGGEEKEAAEKILDMLRYLRKRDLISDRAEARQEVREFEKEQRKEDIAAMRELKEKELTAQVNDLFEAEEKPTVDKRWVQMHRQIYPKLYQTVFPFAENVPDIPSRREMDIINMALLNGLISESECVSFTPA